MADYGFDRFLRYDELRDYLEALEEQHPDLVNVEAYGTSHEGRELLLATVTDTSTGAHDTKPAHWVDANIHATEWTGGVGALYLIHHLLTRFGNDEAVTRALRTRTFYIAPRVNPDGVEKTLTDGVSLRSSTRHWPWGKDVETMGVLSADVDGDGRTLTMRVPDPDGPFMASSKDPRLMVVVPAEGVPDGTERYRLLPEGRYRHHDGFTLATPRDPQGLDLNRNFPAGWATSVPGSGDHPLSEPEIDHLVRAVKARPNICGYNAFHTAAGWLLRPSSTQPDSKLPPADVWFWKRLGAKGTELTGYPVASVYEDFTWDKDDTMAGAADDWAYEHLGVFAWTTEFWDVIKHATGEPQSMDFWYFGATEEQELAVARWCAEHGLEDALVPWRTFDHPDLGVVEIGGWDDLRVWSNAPLPVLRQEVAPHAEFAVHHALAAPEIRCVQHQVLPLGEGTYRVEVGIANVGYLPTTVSVYARKHHLVLPLVATLDGVEMVAGTSRQELGQLGGRIDAEMGAVGSPDRVLATWLVRGEPGQEVTVRAEHPRAGSDELTLTL